MLNERQDVGGPVEDPSVGLEVERLMPGWSMAIMWSGKGARAHKAASRREVGKPWK
jgi:hypothetical protein